MISIYLMFQDQIYLVFPNTDGGFWGINEHIMAFNILMKSESITHLNDKTW